MILRKLVSVPSIKKILVAIALVGAPHAAAKTLPVDAIRATIEDFMRITKVVGLQVAVRHADGSEWSEGFGHANLENSILVTPATSFRLASISKTVTAAAVMRLAERGEIDLDAPVQTYCPQFPVKPWPISSRQLLAHLAGIRHYENDEFNSTKPFNSIVAGLDIFKNDPLLFQPGTKFWYSTYGYSVLGCVAEGASHQTFDHIVLKEVFRPAHMTAARLDSVHDLIPRRASGYARDEGETAVRNADLADTSYKFPGGGIVATASDLVSFAHAHLDNTLLHSDTVQAMWSAQTPRTGEKSEYGLGWILETRNNHREVYHTGSQQGASTVVYMQPDENLVIAVLSNDENAKCLRLARILAGLIVGQATPEDWTKKLDDATQPDWFERIKS